MKNLNVPAEVMQQLRTQALAMGRRGSSQKRAAQLLDCSERTIQEWEKRGGPIIAGYAYVGLARRIHGERVAVRCLELLAQLDHVEGVAVALRLANG